MEPCNSRWSALEAPCEFPIRRFRKTKNTNSQTTTPMVPPPTEVLLVNKFASEATVSPAPLAFRYRPDLESQVGMSKLARGAWCRASSTKKVRQEGGEWEGTPHAKRM